MRKLKFLKKSGVLFLRAQWMDHKKERAPEAS
jgi:hypothetical protein